MDRHIVDAYESGGNRLRTALAGLAEQDLLWAPARDAGVGFWSIHQIVIHLMDSDLIWTGRILC